MKYSVSVVCKECSPTSPVCIHIVHVTWNEVRSVFIVQGAFERFDADRSGSVEPHELHTALSTFGYNLSAQAQGAMVRHFATDGKIGFDSFVACCVKLRVLTSKLKSFIHISSKYVYISVVTAAFQQRDAMRNGTATFRYDDFIAVVMGI